MSTSLSPSAERIQSALRAKDLFALGGIWAAAGTPNAVFRLDSRDLAELTGGQVAEIKA